MAKDGTVDSLGDCVDMIFARSTLKFMGAEKATSCPGYSMTLPGEQCLQNCEGVIKVLGAQLRMHTEGALAQASSESPMSSRNRGNLDSGTVDAPQQAVKVDGSLTFNIRG